MSCRNHVGYRNIELDTQDLLVVQVRQTGVDGGQVENVLVRAKDTVHLTGNVRQHACNRKVKPNEVERSSNVDSKYHQVANSPAGVLLDQRLIVRSAGRMAHVDAQPVGIPGACVRRHRNVLRKVRRASNLQ
jgi:hypothetical protein